MSDEIPDTEDAARTWARAALPTFSGRVFFGFPAGTPALPLLTVARVSGSTDPGPAIDYPRLTWSVWGQNKKDAADGMRALVAALRGINSSGGVALNPVTWCYQVEDIFTVWIPDDEAKLARYVVDVTLVVRVNVAA